MKQLLVFAVIVYIIICILMYAFQRRLLYFPQPISFPVVTSENLKEIKYLSGNISLNGWVLNPGREKALLYYGGNAEQIELNIEFFEGMRIDYSVYLIPYRGYGNNQGLPSEQALYGDALTIYDQIQRDHTQIALMGRSLGSGIATHVAARKPVSKLILVTPYDSIENVAKDAYRVFPISWLIKDRFESFKNAEYLTAQTLVLAAEKDRVITPARTEALIGAFTHDTFKVVTIEGADHNNIGLYPTYMTEIRKLLAK